MINRCLTKENILQKRMVLSTNAKIGGKAEMSFLKK